MDQQGNGGNGANGRLDAVLRPRSVAVIGASRTKETPGLQVLRNIRTGGFTGSLYAVNPNADEIDGVPCYPSVPDLPEPVDLAVVAVPAQASLEVARLCANRGVKGLLFITAGFAEEGGAGADRQRELLEICRAAKMRLVGPNSMGLINTDPAVRLDATFSPVTPTPGTVAFLSQSGGLGVAVMAMADELSVGMSVFVSIGNRADVSANDVLEFVEHDENTDVVLLYVESFGNPRNFSRIARRVSLTTPIVAVKGGRSAAGALATASHTGALVAESDATVDALFRQAGIIRADTLEELLDIGSLLTHFPLPAGPRTAIVSNAGGVGVLAADACETAGLSTPAFSAGLRDRLATVRPGMATRNPVDLLPGASAEDLAEVISVVVDSGEVDNVVVAVVASTTGDDSEILDRLLQVSANAGHTVPIVPVLVADRCGQDTFVFGAPERAVRALGHAWDYRQWRDADHGRLPALSTDERGAHAAISEVPGHDGWMTTDQVSRLLRSYGIPMVVTRQVPDPTAAGAAAHEIGAPVAIKGNGPTLLHKSDAGAVLLDVKPENAEAEAAAMVARLAKAGHQVESLTVQQMSGEGVELIVGVVHDATFGPVVACGAGGVLTELLKDVSLRLAPLTDVDAATMLRELRTYPLLTGYRGSPEMDVAAVENVLLRVGRLAERHPAIAELDINPLVVTPDGPVAVDARVRVAYPNHRRGVSGATG